MMCNVKARWSPADRRVIVDFPRERGGRARMTSTHARKFLAKKMVDEMLPAGVAPGTVIGPRQTPSAGYVGAEAEVAEAVKRAFGGYIKGVGSIATSTTTNAFGTTTKARLVPCERCADDNALGIQEPNHASH
jgi:hypothetical protein